MVCLDRWAFQIGLVITGVLGNKALAINSIITTSIGIIFMVSCECHKCFCYIVHGSNITCHQLGVGIGIAALIRVGNELGAGNPTAAKQAAYVSLALAGELIVLQSCYTVTVSTQYSAAAVSSVAVLLFLAIRSYIAHHSSTYNCNAH